MKKEHMTEAYFRKHIINPWLKKHADYWLPTTGILARNGVPDYIACFGKLIVFIEAKSVGGKLSPYQKNEIAKLEKARQIVIVATPLNWEIVIGEIKAGIVWEHDKYRYQ